MEKFDSDYYGEKWILWDDMKVNGPAARHTRRNIFNLIKNLNFDTIIDISCGGGHLLAEFFTKYKTAKLSGTEFTEKAILENRKRYPSIDFLQLDVSKNFLKTKFDLVLCIDVLEHIEEDQEALKNLRQMTGKYLVIAVPLGNVSTSERLSLGHVHGYSTNEILGKIHMSGFQILKSYRWGFPFYNCFRFITKRTTSSPAEGKASTVKTIVFQLIYYLYFLSLPILGDRFFALCALDEQEIL